MKPRDGWQVGTTRTAIVLDGQERLLVSKKLCYRSRIARDFARIFELLPVLVRKLVDLVFDGSAHRLVAHVLESDRLSDQEREELRRLIDTDAKPEK